MDATTLVEDVRDGNNTELSRLGSSKAIYADTDGEMEPETVLVAAADALSQARETVDGWAGDGDVDGVFSVASEELETQYGEVLAELDAHEPGDVPAAVDAMRDLDSAGRRLGALVGWTLVTQRKASQFTGFFTGQAKPTTASIFRGFDDGYESIRADALAALDTVCDTDDDWDRAETATTAVVQAAYDEYVERLEAQGVKPKPVC